MFKEKQNLRFGILCEELRLQKWQVSAISNAISIPEVELSVVITCDGAIEDRADKKNHFSDFNYILWKLYYAFIVKIFSTAASNIDIRKEFENIPQIHCTTDAGFSDSVKISPEVVEAVLEYAPDFILNFLPKKITGALLDSTRFGIWQFYHGNVKAYGQHPPCIWEMYNRDPVTEFGLVKTTKDINEFTVLKNGYLKTQPFSYNLQINKIYNESVIWPHQVCTDILDENTEYITVTKRYIKPAPDKTPTNLECCLLFLKMVKNLLSLLMKELIFVDKWNVGIIREPIEKVIKIWGEADVEWFPDARDRFVADPFVVRRNEKTYVFFEELNYSHGIGTIAYRAFDNYLKPLSENVIMEHDFHMSYPFLLKLENSIYCIPEAHEKNEIALYEASEFPTHWRKKQVLIPGFQGVDTTVYRYEDRWWMFTSDKNNGVNHKLHIWYSEEIFGPWIPHPGNPVKVDVRSARSAGTLFTMGGELFRPSQDYSERRQGKITINRITKLTPTIYEEESVFSLAPDKNGRYPDAIHTITDGGDLTVIDSCREEFIGKNPTYVKFLIMFVYRRLKKTITNK